MDRATTEKWLFDELTSRLADALAALAGVRPEVSWNGLPSAPHFPEEGSLWWRQPLAPLPGAASIAAAQDAWSGLGEHILNAAKSGEHEIDARSAYIKLLGQGLSGLALSLTRRLQEEVTCAAGEETAALPSEAPSSASWAVIYVPLGEKQVSMAAGFDAELMDSLGPGADPPHPSQTFDLLLDVELPVSVSFGHAQVLLKDVLKLTTGSIIELDRAVVEPVDILVNHCVIARGEVVVVEGNFGVRIQRVVSRRERLSTLQ